MKADDITPLMVVSVPFFGVVVAIVMIGVLYAKVSSADRGEGKQVEISDKVRAGAIAFLKAEYAWLAPFVGAMSIVIVSILETVSTPKALLTSTGATIPSSSVAPPSGGWETMVSFIIGATFSAAAGWGGMVVATDTNVKTTQAAKVGLNPALKIAFAGGAIMGFTVVCLGLLGLCILFLSWSTKDSLGSVRLEFLAALQYCSGFAFGASSIALFARVAGGIYTKAADVGADLVGKVEANIPEDDPRNPATIADNVGDNVGDVAGMGADLFESYVGSIVAAATLGAQGVSGAADPNALRDVAYPFWIAGFGVLAAAVGFWTVSTKDDADQKDLLHALHSGVYVSSILVVGFSALCSFLLYTNGDYNFDGSGADSDRAWRNYGCVLVGLVTGIAIGEATEYSTSYAFQPTKSITEAGTTGPATVIIQGLGIGMLSCVPPVLLITIAVLACNALSNVYGVALAAVGMLSTLGVTLATDAYGPVADNAGGIAEMCEDILPEVRERTDLLDALGNTTAATGKGFAIGSAVLTALAFMSAFNRSIAFNGITPVDLTGENMDAGGFFSMTNALVLGGMLVGAMLPFLFAALTMLSVRKAAGAIIVEVRRQFREIDGLLEGREGVEPEVEKCVKISTESSLKEMILPGIISIMTPFAVGLLVGARCLGGLLMGSIASGFLLAVMMSNAGGAWDNAKKYVENEHPIINGEEVKKKSDVHKAVVVGDTVGDPFKDTSGPALNILLKLMSVLSLTFSSLWGDDWEAWIAGLIVLLLEFAFIFVAYYYVWVLDDTDEKIAQPERMQQSLTADPVVEDSAADVASADQA